MPHEALLHPERRTDIIIWRRETIVPAYRLCPIPIGERDSWRSRLLHRIQRVLKMEQKSPMPRPNQFIDVLAPPTLVWQYFRAFSRNTHSCRGADRSEWAVGPYRDHSDGAL